jgi:protein transport protein SEC31
MLWDGASLTRAGGAANGAAPPPQPLARLAKHAGPVPALQFNAASPNLLASGGADGELCIWDVARPTAPSLYPPLRAGGPAPTPTPAPDVAALAWNAKVAHILAAAAGTGATTVWDLKKQRPVLALRDAAHRMRRPTAVSWSPVDATRVAVACGDDASPVVQVWDLRAATAPVAELAGHARGVTAASWCPHDPALLLTTGRDGRACLWDADSGALLGEAAPSGGEPLLGASWAPAHAGAYAARTATRALVASCAAFAAPAADGGAEGGWRPLARAPAWLARRASVSAGFGGVFASVSAEPRVDAATGVEVAPNAVAIHAAPPSSSLARAAADLGAALGPAGDRSALATLCAHRADAARTEARPDDAEAWALLAALCGDDPRAALPATLGLGDAVAAAASPRGAAPPSVDGAHPPSPPRAATAAPAGGLFAGDGASFFESLAPLPASATATPRQPGSPGRGGRPSSGGGALTPRPGGDGGDDPAAAADDARVGRCLLVGNFAGALDACLACGRDADALLVAAAGGEGLWAKAAAAVARRAPRPYSRLLKSLADNDLAGLVKAAPLDGWRDTLAALAVFAGADAFPGLADALAKRAAAAGMVHAAACAAAAAGNVDGAVGHWAAQAGVTGGDGSATDAALHSVVERGVVLARAAGAPSPALDALLAAYADRLAGDGAVAEAGALLSAVPPAGSAADDPAALARDRVYRSGRAPASVPPPFPFAGVAPPSDAAGGVSRVGATAPAQAYAPAAATSFGGYGGGSSASLFDAMAYTTTGAYAAPAAAAPPLRAAAAPQPPASFAPAGAASAYAPPPPVASGFAPAGAASGYAPPPPVAPPAPLPPPPAPVATSAFAPAGAASGYSAPTAGGWGAPPASAPPPPASPAAAFAPPPTAPPAGGVYVPSRAPAGGPPAATFAPAPPSAGGYGGFAAPAAPSGYGAAPGAPPAPRPATPPPPPPAGPPANVTAATVDVSAVPPTLRGAARALRTLADAAVASAAGAPGKKREADDSTRRVGAMLWKLNAGEVSAEVGAQLAALGAAVDACDWGAAAAAHASLTANHWDECSPWLTAVKRLIKGRAGGR